jgi:hypothetical protein
MVQVDRLTRLARRFQCTMIAENWCTQSQCPVCLSEHAVLPRRHPHRSRASLSRRRVTCANRMRQMLTGRSRAHEVTCSHSPVSLLCSSGSASAVKASACRLASSSISSTPLSTSDELAPCCSRASLRACGCACMHVCADGLKVLCAASASRWTHVVPSRAVQTCSHVREHQPPCIETLYSQDTLSVASCSCLALASCMISSLVNLLRASRCAVIMAVSCVCVYVYVCMCA